MLKKKWLVFCAALFLLLAIGCAANGETSFQIANVTNRVYVPGQLIGYSFTPDRIAEWAGEEFASLIDPQGMTCTVSDPEVLMPVTTNDGSYYSFLALQPGQCTVKCTTADGAYSFTEKVTVIDLAVPQIPDITLNGKPLEETKSVSSFASLTLSFTEAGNTSLYLCGRQEFLNRAEDSRLYRTFMADDTVETLDIILIQEKTDREWVYDEQTKSNYIDEIDAMIRIRIPVTHEDAAFLLTADETTPLANTEITLRAEGTQESWFLLQASYEYGNGIWSVYETNVLSPDETVAVPAFDGLLWAWEAGTGRRSNVIEIRQQVLGEVSSVPVLNGIPFHEVKELTAGRVYWLTAPVGAEEQFASFSVCCSNDSPGVSFAEGNPIPVCFAPGSAGEAELNIVYQFAPGYVADLEGGGTMGWKSAAIRIQVVPEDSQDADLRGIRNGFETHEQGALLFMTENGNAMYQAFFTGSEMIPGGVTQYIEETPCTMFYGNEGELVYWIADEAGRCSPLTLPGHDARTASLSAGWSIDKILLDGKPISSYDTLSTAHYYLLTGTLPPGNDFCELRIEGQNTYTHSEQDGPWDGFGFTLDQPTDQQKLYLVLKNGQEQVLLYSGPVTASGGFEFPVTEEGPEQVDLIYNGNWGFPSSLEAGTGIIIMFQIPQACTWSVEMNGSVLFQWDTDPYDPEHLSPLLEYLEFFIEDLGNDRNSVWSSMALTDNMENYQLLLRFTTPDGTEMIYPLAIS